MIESSPVTVLRRACKGTCALFFEDIIVTLQFRFHYRGCDQLIWISEIDSRITWSHTFDTSSTISSSSSASTPTCATCTIDIGRGIITLPSHRYDASTQSWDVPALPIKPSQTRELVYLSRSTPGTYPQGSMEWKYLGRYECVWEELVEMDKLEGICDKVTFFSSLIVDGKAELTLLAHCFMFVEIQR